MSTKNGNGEKPEVGRRNPVAKFAGKFNKAQTHRDRTKYYRKDKHKKGRTDPFCLGADKYFIWSSNTFILRVIELAMRGGQLHTTTS